MALINWYNKINSWSDFKNLLDTKTKQEKGQAFEELTKYYLQYNAVYTSKLKQVWLLKEVPPSIIKKLNLPTNDQGIDLIAETVEGTYWAIQCKYLQEENQRLSHRAISTFVSLSTGIATHITYCLVCTTVDEYAKIYKGKTNIGFVNSDEWRKLDKDFFDWVRAKLIGKNIKRTPFKPKPHQVIALKEAKNYFLKENNNRGKLVFPCGAGKSLTGYWITKELKSKSIIVAVPSLSLVKQTLEVYLRETNANNDKVSWLCVCSDEGIGTNDDVAIYTNEIGVPCVTDKNFIAKWIKDNSTNKTIIFSTYQSGKTIADACKIANHEFDLGIMDEAHKTVGDKDKLFSHLLFDKNIKIKKRIFMTATERRYAGSSDTILSMDDAEVYGDTFTQLSFKKAIEIGILSDYKIITLFISNNEVRKLIEKNAFVKPLGKDWDNETEARTLASLIAIRKAMTDYPINHAVTFHSSIKKAEAFEQSQAVFSKVFPKYSKVNSYHVSGAMPTSVRGKIVDEFANSEKGIITNAKCLTEGVDVPNIDCVLFADPRKSKVDIIQAVGRALRKKEGKEFGYVILPVFTDANNKEEIIESEEFKDVLSTIRALASNDERIIEEFKDISKGKKGNRKDSLLQFNIDVNIAELINENELIESIQLKTWDKLAKLTWMPFEEARDYVRGLGFKNQKEWINYSKSKKKPIDIPATPNTVYKNIGWKSLGDWLGNFVISNQNKIYLPFEEAREYVRKLKLKGQNDWANYSKSKERPNNIPGAPNKTYKDKGWIDLGDWLGTFNTSSHNRIYKSFEEAKKFVHTLNLKSHSEWINYNKSGSLPKDIPKKPERVYKYNGWNGIGDWLGSGTIAPQLKVYLSFTDARKFVQKLKLKSTNEWNQYCHSTKKPENIPMTPDRIYKKSGWISWGDWLGTGIIATFYLQYRMFNTARKFVHSLKLKNQTEWNNYCKSGLKPKDIPTAANSVYKNKGWVRLGDWLGNNVIATQDKIFCSYEESKKIAQKLNIKKVSDWKKYARSKNNKLNIPIVPEKVYINKGWVSWADFLGTENFFRKNRLYKSFNDCKKWFAKNNIKTSNEWREFKKKLERPDYIPALPDTYYKNKGWKGWNDFLGKE